MYNEKTETLFNKNHISITKITHKEKPKFSLNFDPENYMCSNREPSNYYYHKPPKNETSKIITERRKSPLGFYYNCHKIVSSIYPETFNFTNNNLMSLHLIVGKIEYILKYYTTYENNSISIDTRPWQIADKKSFDDRYVNVLLEEVNKFFTIADDNKILYYKIENNNVVTKSITDIKKSVFKDLFGYPEGPKYQTNNEKILSHGFDLKTSFRKMKSDEK